MKRSPKMLHTIPAIMLAAVILLLPSCGQSSGDTQEVVFRHLGDVYYEQGVFRFVDGLAYFADAESGNYVPLCDKPNCLHQKNSLSNPNSTCNAAIDAPTTVFPYRDKLYILAEENLDSLSIYQMDLNGANRKLVGKIDGPQCTDSTKDLSENYIFISYKNRYDFENNMFEPKYVEHSVVMFDLDAYKFIDLPKKTGSATFSSIGNVHIVDDSVFYSYGTVSEKIPEGLTNDEEWEFWQEHCICTLYRYDLSTGIETPIFTSESLFGAHYSGEFALLCSETGEVSLINLITEEQEFLFDGSNIHLESIGDFNSEQIIYSTYEDGTRDFRVYDLATKTHRLVKTDANLSIEAIVGDKVYYFGIVNGEYAYSVMEREDFLNGHFAKRKVLYYPNRENPNPNAG